MAKTFFAISQFFAVSFWVADGKELLCRLLADGKELADGKVADSSSARWEFLEDVLKAKGYDPLWISWMRQLVQGGQTAVNINGEVGPYFRNQRGVRQGDPISPLLFNILADALASILDRAKGAGHISGVAEGIIPGGITHLQYADDTLIFIKNSEREILNLNSS